MIHILLQNAFIYKRRKVIIAPVAFQYDRFVGAWLSTDDYSLLINNKDFPNIGSKKFDVETGEDHKGQ